MFDSVCMYDDNACICFIIFQHIFIAGLVGLRADIHVVHWLLNLYPDTVLLQKCVYSKIRWAGQRYKCPRSPKGAVWSAGGTLAINESMKIKHGPQLDLETNVLSVFLCFLCLLLSYSDL